MEVFLTLLKEALESVSEWKMTLLPLCLICKRLVQWCSLLIVFTSFNFVMITLLFFLIGRDFMKQWLMCFLMCDIGELSIYIYIYIYMNKLSHLCRRSHTNYVTFIFLICINKILYLCLIFKLSNHTVVQPLHVRHLYFEVWTLDFLPHPYLFL